MPRKASPAKPPKKPYPDFPLFAHASGQWAKTIHYKTHYFGRWDDWEQALERFKREVNYLQTGQAPPAEFTSLGVVLDKYVDSKQAALDLGELTQRTFDEYVSTCDVIAKLGNHRAIDSLGSEDFTRLRLTLSKGKGGKRRSPTRHKVLLQHARSVFYYANEELGFNIRYRKGLRSPSAKDIRIARANIGERLFTPKEINALIKAAKPQLKAMIYLGINCGLGNEDVATLPIAAIDFVNGWHNYHRPKTGAARRCKLWTETIKALKAAIKVRPVPKNPDNAGLVFITKYGYPWNDDEGRNNPLAQEFRKLANEVKIYRKGVTVFYSLRRTFNTIGETANRPKALQFAMGHLPDANDMGAVYRQRTFDKPLVEITTQVRKWLEGSIKLS